MAGFSEYEVAWGGAGLLFAIAGSRSLARVGKLHGSPPGLVLRIAPACAAVLTLVGARLHALLGSPIAFGEAVSEGRLWEVAMSGGQRITGGLLLAAAFLGWVVPWASGRRFGGGEILDAIIPAAGASIAIGRVGCFLVGCCFGVPTTLPWATVYPPGAPAYWNHLAQGLIDPSEASAAVHPLSLYLGGIAAAAALGSHLLVRRPGGRPGRVTLAFAVALSAGRLVVEPLREVQFLGAVPGQQWLSALILSSALVLMSLEARPRPGPGLQGKDIPKGTGPSRPGTPRRCTRRATSPSSPS